VGASLHDLVAFLGDAVIQIAYQVFVCRVYPSIGDRHGLEYAEHVADDAQRDQTRQSIEAQKIGVEVWISSGGSASGSWVGGGDEFRRKVVKFFRQSTG
jgi:hypothetical protein